MKLMIFLRRAFAALALSATCAASAANDIYVAANYALLDVDVSDESAADLILPATMLRLGVQPEEGWPWEMRIGFGSGGDDARGGEQVKLANYYGVFACFLLWP